MRDRRPADRGQARRRPLARRRPQIDGASGLGLGLDARHRRPHHPSRRDAGDDPRHPRQASRPAGGARGDAPGDAAPRLAFRARADHRGGARPRPRPRASSAIRSTCWARARAPPPTPAKYFDAYAGAIAAIGASARQCGVARAPRHFGKALGAASALRGDLARARAQGAGAAADRARAARQGARSCSSPSMPRRRTGSNFRST